MPSTSVLRKRRAIGVSSFERNHLVERDASRARSRRGLVGWPLWFGGVGVGLDENRNAKSPRRRYDLFLVCGMSGERKSRKKI